jgi:hypothetical protein
MRSGLADDAGATMEIEALGATAGGLIRLGISPCLSASDECGWSREQQLFGGAVPCNGLRTAGAQFDEGDQTSSKLQ